jgi:hypothetical protein
MKTTNLCFIILCISLTGFAQTPQPMGLGIAKVNFSMESQTLYFYADPDSEKITDSVVVHADYIDYAPPWLFPEFLKPDYNICHFRMLTVTRDRVRVIVNKQTGQTGWMSREELNCQYWPDFLISVFAVYSLDEKVNPWRVRPLDHGGLFLTSDKVLRYEAIAVEGDWLLAEARDTHEKVIGKAWIRWRRGEELLVSYDLLS